ncbi:MAG: sulfatase-like hydrolase/transferase [Planctomycetota bacterium]|jgi:arylsulfatase A-like enzyme
MTAKSLPNMVLITADQWRADCLGSLRSPHPVITPHVDQLAAEGVLFEQAWADCPVCMPQRITQLTGQVASRFGMTTNFMNGPRPQIDSASTLPARLAREAGYQTKAVGKMHFYPDRARYGFEHISLHPDDYVNWLEENGYGGFYRGHGLGGNEVYPAVSAVPERYTHTHWIVDRAIEFLGARDPECPFFLWIVFEAPHSPFDPPEPFDRMYDNFTIPDPVRGEWVDGENAPAFFHDKPLTHNYDLLSPEVIREARRRYYGQISHIDYQLGRLFGELRTRGLYEDTAIVFTADHGEHLGDHGVFSKTTYLASSGMVPLVLRLPRGTNLAHPALRLRSPAMTADIPPTLLELAGLEPDAETDGASQLPAIAAGSSEARTLCGECGPHAFATDGKHKYLYYARRGSEQLFDCVGDPGDLRDLSQSPEGEEPRKRLRAALVEHLAKHASPLVADGELIVGGHDPDEHDLRSTNPFAWRGPMRHGRGYSG